MTALRPNVLMVVADCGRADKWVDPGRRTRTPTIDALRQSGLTFPTAIVEMACTTPSFTGLLTGRYSPRHGVHMVWGDRLADSVPMLTEVLAANGYHTYAEVTGPLLPESLLRGLASRYRLLLLSNTNAIHFEMIRQAYPMLRHFDDMVLSYQVGALKPGPEIFQVAIQRAGCRPEECFYTDDTAAHVEAARALGIDAEQFVDRGQLEGELTARGIRWDWTKEPGATKTPG